jgi:hypothetical protein
MRLTTRLLPLSLALLLLGAIPSGAQDDSSDRREVLAVLQRLSDAMHVRDTAAIRAAFEPGARLVGMRPGPAGSTHVQLISVNQLVDFLARDKRPDLTERIFDPEVRVSGTLATVWADYDLHFGSTFAACGVDAVQLLKLPEGWRIVAIADSTTMTGCVKRSPP